MELKWEIVAGHCAEPSGHGAGADQLCGLGARVRGALHRGADHQLQQQGHGQVGPGLDDRRHHPRRRVRILHHLRLGGAAAMELSRSRLGGETSGEETGLVFGKFISFY